MLIKINIFSNNKQNQLAAMFGLDARIALAIFGALSVITGAALYSAIGNAKAIAVLNDMQEFSKAMEAYYLDTGVLPSTRPNSAYTIYNIDNLVINRENIKGWKGPYLNYNVLEEYRLEYPKYDFYCAFRFNDLPWGDDINPALANTGYCKIAQNCYVWVRLFAIEDDTLFNILDKKVDGEDGKKSGKVRFYDKRLYLQSISVKI